MSKKPKKIDMAHTYFMSPTTAELYHAGRLGLSPYLKGRAKINKINENITNLIKKGYYSFEKGGKVKKTGVYKLHKGERVLNKKQTRNFDAKEYKRVHKKVFGT